jgi:hypothetical protein
MRFKKLLIAGVLTGLSVPVLADVNYTQGAGTVIFAFTCFTTKVCPAHVLTSSTGTELMTSANPGLISVSQGGNVAVVKAASTAAAVADPSQATNESPNSQLSVAVGTTGDAANAATVVGQLKQITSNTGSPIPAGASIIGKVGIDQTTPGTTNGVQVNAALPTGTNTIGSVKQTDGTNVVITDPCRGVAKSYTPINISASGSIRIITGTAAKKTYICHIHLVTNALNNVAMTEGTGTNCGTGTAGVIGGTTAASGWNFAANSGIALGNGSAATIAAAVANADDVCLNPSAATQLSGQVVWVQQ